MLSLSLVRCRPSGEVVTVFAVVALRSVFGGMSVLTSGSLKFVTEDLSRQAAGLA